MRLKSLEMILLSQENILLSQDPFIFFLTILLAQENTVPFYQDA